MNFEQLKAGMFLKDREAGQSPGAVNWMLILKKELNYAIIFNYWHDPKIKRFTLSKDSVDRKTWSGESIVVGIWKRFEESDDFGGVVKAIFESEKII
jgi:hypothetical protein